MKRVALTCVFALIACNKQSGDVSNELAVSAGSASVATPAGTVAASPVAVTVNQGPAAAAPKNVVVGGSAGTVQVQAGSKRIEVAGSNGRIDVSGLAAKAAGTATPNPAPLASPPAAPAKTGPCAQLAAKCPKCTLPMLKQTCNLAVSSGDPASCQNGLNDRDVQANCK